MCVLASLALSLALGGSGPLFFPDSLSLPFGSSPYSPFIYLPLNSSSVLIAPPFPPFLLAPSLSSQLFLFSSVSVPPLPSPLPSQPLPSLSDPPRCFGSAPSASFPLAPPLHYTLPSRSRPSCLTPPLPLSLPSGPALLHPPFWAATPPPFLAPSVPPSLLAAPPPFLAPPLLS